MLQVRPTSSDTSSVTIDDFLKWRDARRQRAEGRPYAANTQASVRDRLLAAMRAADTEDLSVLCHSLTSADDIERLFDRLALTNGSSSLRQVYEALRSLHGFALAQRWVEGPFPDTDELKPPSRDAQKDMATYTEDELDRLVESARGRSLRWFMFMAHLVHTGRRIGETRQITWDMLTLDTERPHFTLPMQIVKTKRQQVIALDRFLREEAYTPANIKVLQAEPQRRFKCDLTRYAFPWGEKTARSMLERHCKVIGLESTGFHKFRHSFATIQLQKGKPIQAVSAWLGHASVQTTDRMYNHVKTLDYAYLLDDD